MLSAIEDAAGEVILCSYIFRADAAGLPFIDALVRAKDRGVRVRVLLDGIGAGYFRSKASRLLAEAGIPVARFLHTWVPWRMPFVNMRLHKKLLVVDGRVGFTGGMNIGAENLTANWVQGEGVRDLHFRVTGPIVWDLVATFEQDWQFAGGEPSEPESPETILKDTGTAMVRGIQSGPDEDIMKLEGIMIGGINAARSRIRVVTPYFLPDRTLQMALLFAALRGVHVEIILPRRSDHRFLDWANRSQVGPLLEAGCHVILTEQPFDHSKIMTVDGAWSVVGSANWDVRSLRLNFEYNLEVWDQRFADELGGIIDGKLVNSRMLTKKDLRSPPLAKRLRNAAARLLLPYL
jgi:cardiolipin synthase